MIFLALVIGIIAGLRAAMAPATVSWAAARGGMHLEGSWLTFLGWRYKPWILTLLAVGELITDQLPSTPNRKVPVQFGARLASGGLSGAVIGTYGGAAARGFLADAFKSDRPAALIEDVVAIALAWFVYTSLVARTL